MNHIPPPFGQFERSELGYDKHNGSISVTRSTSDLPRINWDAVIADERTRLDMLVHLTRVRESYDIDCFVNVGRLRQHTDIVDAYEVTAGMILDCANDFELNSGGKRLNMKPGDQFILNPHVRHGAETAHRFIFVASDRDRNRMINASEMRTFFVDVLQSIALDYPAP